MKWKFSSIEKAYDYLNNNCLVCEFNLDKDWFCKKCNIIYNIHNTSNDFTNNDFCISINLFYKGYQIIFEFYELRIFIIADVKWRTLPPILELNNISKFIKNIDKYLVLQ